MAKKTSESGTETRTYVCKLVDEKFRKIVVPASWKASFGPVMLPVTQRNGHTFGVALRFWEGNKDNQRALYSDVVAFHDTTITEVEHTADLWTVVEKAA